jgi:hypothetical protein
MVRRVVIGIVAASTLLIWKSDFLHTFTTGNQTYVPINAGPVLSDAATAMSQLKTVSLKFEGTAVGQSGASYTITGTGTLTYPHDEDLQMQFSFPPPAATSDGPIIIPINERIKAGHVYIQVNGGKWQDVTSTSRGDIPAGMDPISNLGFASAFRSSDDLGDMAFAGTAVHHFTLSVDDGKYLELLKADKSNPLSPSDEAMLHTAGITCNVWIGVSDHYVYQLEVHLSTSQLRWDVTYTYSNFVKGGATTA